MKHFFSLFFSLLSLFTACQKIEIADQTEEKKTEDKTDANETVTDTTAYYTVATLSQADDDTQVELKCYIVGYMPSYSIKNVVFSSDDAVETNLVVADSPDETNSEQCATVQLKKDTDARKQLNLCNNPEMLHSHVLLMGTKSEYCYATGLKSVKQFRLLETDENDDHNENDSTLQEPFPTISADHVDIFEGA